jgi:hypothetical protein
MDNVVELPAPDYRKKTPELVQRFLEILIESGSVSRACREVGLSRWTAYRWRDEDEQFARDWTIAKDNHVDVALERLAELALEGDDEPQFYQGRVVGHRKVRYPQLTIYYLERLSPFQVLQSRARPDLPPQALHRSARVADVLSQSNKEADRLAAVDMPMEDGTPALPAPAKPPLSDEELLKHFRSANTAIEPLGARVSDVVDGGIDKS